MEGIADLLVTRSFPTYFHNIFLQHVGQDLASVTCYVSFVVFGVLLLVGVCLVSYFLVLLCLSLSFRLLRSFSFVSSNNSPQNSKRVILHASPFNLLHPFPLTSISSIDLLFVFNWSSIDLSRLVDLLFVFRLSFY